MVGSIFGCCGELPSDQPYGNQSCEYVKGRRQQEATSRGLPIITGAVSAPAEVVSARTGAPWNARRVSYERRWISIGDRTIRVIATSLH